MQTFSLVVVDSYRTDWTLRPCQSLCDLESWVALTRLAISERIFGGPNSKDPTKQRASEVEAGPNIVQAAVGP